MKRLSRRRKNWLLIVASVIGVYVILSIDLSRPSSQQRADNESSQPQWILSQAVIENFDLGGNISTRLHTSDARFFNQEDSIKLTTPIIEYFQADTIRWQAQADSGEVFRNVNTLVLSDNVLLQNLANQQTINTQWLSSDFNKSLLKTDKAVTITSPNTRSTATGMTGNWKTKTLSLLNDVHVQITPNR